MKKPSYGVKKPVICYELHRRYSSMASAERAIGVTGIWLALDKPDRTCGGYHWRSPENKSFKPVPTHTRKKKVLCIETGEIFNSCVEAAESVLGLADYISNCGKGIKHTYKGYHWVYLDENGVPLYTRLHVPKFVLNVATGIVYENINVAAEFAGVKKVTMEQYIRNYYHTGKGDWKYLEKSDLIPQGKPVRCIETGEMFLSSRKTAEFLGEIDEANNLRHAITGYRGNQSFHGLHWEYCDPAWFNAGLATDEEIQAEKEKYYEAKRSQWWKEGNF